MSKPLNMRSFFVSSRRIVCGTQRSARHLQRNVNIFTLRTQPSATYRLNFYAHLTNQWIFNTITLAQRKASCTRIFGPRYVACQVTVLYNVGHGISNPRKFRICLPVRVNWSACARARADGFEKHYSVARPYNYLPPQCISAIMGS